MTHAIRSPAIILFMFLPLASWSQGTAEDYKRAETLRERTRDKVFRSAVEPNWIGKTSRFWYRNDLSAGRREFILVDSEAAKKQPAFDHAKLAESLSKTLAKQIEADKLPVDRIAFPEGRDHVLIAIEDKTYAVNLQSYDVKPDTASIPRQATRFSGFTRRNDEGVPLPRSATSPNKTWIALIREYNVFLRSADSGQDVALTSDGKAEDRYSSPVLWSPDSKKLVVFKTIPAQEHKVYEVESSPKDQQQPKLRSFQYLKPGDRIAHSRPHLFDVESLKDIPIKDDLFPNPWDEPVDVHWAADSSRFTFLYNQRGHQVMRLISVDATSGEAKAVIDEQSKTFIDWTNKVYLHRIDASHEAIWMSERDGWNHMYLYDTATAQVKNQITKGEWVVRGVDRVDESARQIWFRAGGIRPGQDPYYVHYCRVNFDGSGLTVLTEGDGMHRLIQSPDGKFAVDAWSRVDLAPVTELRRLSDGAKVLDLERADSSELVAAGIRFPERFVAKGRDGKTDIHGVIVRPTNFNPAKKYPVIENVYAGPQGAFVPKAFAAVTNMQALAELGFIVVQADGMGTNFRSKAFHDVCWKNLGDAGFQDRILWIKAAAAKYPQMDISRVGIYGTSAGGQSALGGMLLHSDFYKVCVSDCGCHDNAMDKIWWNEQWMGWPIGPHYAEQSNVTLAPKLTGKLLLMVGELDNNVDPASTLQVVNALIKANKDFDLLVVPGAGHGVAGSQYGRRKLQDFFVRNLLGVEPPNRNALAPTSNVGAGEETQNDE